jgi:hypothetical protein
MLLSATIVVLLGLMLFSSGIVTSEKMQLQNAADAAAYSVSTIEARDLNFTAYTNRAMIANEVAIGQVVGLMSWAVHFSSTGPFLSLYMNPFLALLDAATLGAASPFTAVIRGFITALTAVGNTIRGVTRAITTPVVPAMATINKVYSIAQRSFHLISFLFSIFALDEMLSQNTDDAQLSGFGLVALLAHFVTYYGDLPPFDRSFVTSYRQDALSDRPIPQPGPAPTEPEQIAGMERLASIINDARDPFSRNRDGGWSLPIIPEFGFHVEWSFTIPILDIDIIVFDITFSFGISIDRNGGTDLRFIERSGQQLYNWSGADTTAMNLHLFLSAIILNVSLPTIDIDAGPPFGIGAAQAGRATGPRRAVVGAAFPHPSMLPDYGGGDVTEEMYGSSPDMSSIAWLWPGIPPPPSISQQAFTNNIGRQYPGLPRYNDTKPGPDPIDITTVTLGFEAPYLLIGLIKEPEYFDVFRETGKTPPRGRFRLNDNYAADQLGVIAKSEVYFSRPDDLSYFRRADRKIEYGSGFNPYWQARLVDTTYIDRLSALAIQQRQLYLPSLPLGPIIDDISDLRNLLP